MEPAIRDLLANLRRSGVPYRLRVGELAVRCGVSKGAITQRVARAEAVGWVRSTSAGATASNENGTVADAVEMDGDRRAVWIELTQLGKNLVETTIEELLRHEDALVAELGDDEIKALSESLKRFLSLLETPNVSATATEMPE